MASSARNQPQFTLYQPQFTPQRAKRISDPTALRPNFTSETCSVSSEEDQENKQHAGPRISRLKSGRNRGTSEALNPDGENSFEEASRNLMPKAQASELDVFQAKHGKPAWKKIFNKKKPKSKEADEPQYTSARATTSSTDSRPKRGSTSDARVVFTLPDEHSNDRRVMHAFSDDGTASVSAGTVSARSFQTFSSTETPVASNLSNVKTSSGQPSALSPHCEEEDDDPQHQEGQELVYDALNNLFTLGDSICNFPEPSKAASPARKSAFVFYKMNLDCGPQTIKREDEAFAQTQLQVPLAPDNYPLTRLRTKPQKNTVTFSSHFTPQLTPECALQHNLSSSLEIDTATKESHKTRTRECSDVSLPSVDNIPDNKSSITRTECEDCDILFSTSFTDEGGLKRPDKTFTKNSVYDIIEKLDKITEQIDDLTGGKFMAFDPDLTIKRLQSRGADLMKRRQTNESLKVFKELEDVVIDFYGKDHEELGNVWHNKAIVLTKAGRYGEAVSACNEAVRIRKKTLGDNDPNVAVSLSQLGIAHMESGDFPPSLRAFRNALKIREDTLGPNHPKVAKLHNNIGCVLFEIKDLKSAEESFGRALNIQRQMLNSNPPNAEQVLLSIASTQCNLGSIKLILERFDEAIITLEEAMLVQQSVLGDIHKTVLSTQKSIEHAQKLRERRSKTNDESRVSRPIKKLSNQGSVQKPKRSGFCEF